MNQPFLEVTYDPVTNTGVSTYRCGDTEEVIHYQGERNGLVKFTPETWPDYLAKLYGRSLPIEIPGYGYIKYVQDAVAIGVPETVYSQYALLDKDAPMQSKVASIIYERRDYEGNLLERKVIFDEEDSVWMNFDNGSLNVPAGQDPVEFALQYAMENRKEP